MRKRAVEPTGARETSEAGDAAGGGPCLADPSRSSVAADHPMGVAPAFEQLDGVGQRPGGQGHLVAVALHQLDERAEDEHVSGVGEVDPDPHRGTMLLARLGRTGDGTSRDRGRQPAPLVWATPDG